MKRFFISPIILLVSVSAVAFASIFGDVRGVVRDTQGRLVAGATVTISSTRTDWQRAAQTNSAGEFTFRSVPAGEYTLKIAAQGFALITRSLMVVPDNVTTTEIQLEVAGINQHVLVTAAGDTMPADETAPVTLVSREQIARMPGADRTNSLSAISNTVPGVYVTHNQLHIRGGHQATWLVDGVPVPNTNIADTVGAQFDPKDIDFLEVKRGAFSSEFGDRAYGVFNVVPRSGADMKREGEFLASYGNFDQGTAEISLGSHSKRFAWYGSLTGNRSNYGLETPVARVLHDSTNSIGGFASLVYDASPNNEFRVVASARRDFFEVPNDRQAQAAGIRDSERESDGFVNFSWVHTFDAKWVLTVSPFFHYNRAAYAGGARDTAISPQSDRTSEYAGGHAVATYLDRRNSAKAGYYGFVQRDSAFFGIRGMSDDGDPIDLQQRSRPKGSVNAAFVEDEFKPVPWMLLTAGIRFTRFKGGITENSTAPRVGLAVRLPRLMICVHGFYGRYYQAPPLTTLSGPLLEFATQQGFGFVSLKGERDEEYQFGASLPVKGWLIETDYFHTRAANFFDHNALGDSNIFFPVTVDRVRIRGLEASIRSPQLFHRLQLSTVYSHQRIEGKGGVTGGLTDFAPVDDGWFFLDHDQRNTLNANADIRVPHASWLSATLRYGSGFLNGEGPDHLPGHVLFDLAFGHKFGEKWTISLQAVNVANSRFLLDNSETFGGTHFVEPRQIYVQVRRTFHF